MMTPESGVVLQLTEMRLCLSILGYDQWDDIPLLDTEEPLEQRMMNAFLNLIQRGRFLATEGGYQLEPSLRQLLGCIGEAECVYRLYEQEWILALIYEKAGRFVALTPHFGSRQGCKVFYFDDSEVEKIYDSIRDLVPHGEQMNLRKTDKEDSEFGQYNVRELILFLDPSQEWRKQDDIG